MKALAEKTRGRGNIYLTGGASAVLVGWREMTVDVDIKADPEPDGFFEAIADIKEGLNLNVELASPDQFVPELPGWRERSIWCERHGNIDFYHFDFFSQALSKLERGHTRDRFDVAAMLERGLIEKTRLRELFEAVAPKIIRYPGIDPVHFRTVVESFLK